MKLKFCISYLKIVDKCRNQKFLKFLKKLKFNFIFLLILKLSFNNIKLRKRKFLDILFFYRIIYNNKVSIFFYKFLLKNNFDYVNICLNHFFSKYYFSIQNFLNFIVFKKYNFNYKNEKKL